MTARSEAVTAQVLVGHVAALAHRIERLVQPPPDTGISPAPLSALVDELAGWLDEEVGAPQWAVWCQIGPDMGRILEPRRHPDASDGEHPASFIRGHAAEAWIREKGAELIRAAGGLSAAPRDIVSGEVLEDGWALFSAPLWSGNTAGETPMFRMLFRAGITTEVIVVLGAAFNAATTSLVSLATAALRQAAAVLSAAQKYDRRSFSRGTSQFAHAVRWLNGFLPGIPQRALIRLFAVQFLSHLRDTFGESLPPHGEARDSIEREWAELVHIRSSFFAPSELDKLAERSHTQKTGGEAMWEKAMPPATGDLLAEDARIWAGLVTELLLVRALRDMSGLEEILASTTFHHRLCELGWNTGELSKKDREKFAGELADDLLRPGLSRRYGRARSDDDAPSFWKISSLLVEPLDVEARDQALGPTLRAHIDLLLTRWMLLDLTLEIGLLDHRLFQQGENGILTPLWEATARFCRQWRLLHRQWSTLAGVQAGNAEAIRKKVIEWWRSDRGGMGNVPSDGSRCVVGVHIDPIWTNLYLLGEVLEHFSPQGGSPWARVQSEITNESAQRELLRSVARVAAFVLWHLSIQEEHPARFCFLETTSPGAVTKQATTGREQNLHLLPFHEPVGSEPYAQALIQLMEVFGHRVLGVAAAVDIRGYLHRAIESEPLLHAVSDYYRDHLYHLLDLCLLGDFLLTARVGRTANHLWRSLFPPSAKAEARQPYRLDEIRRQWFVAAVFHDVGYLFTLLARASKLLPEHAGPSHETFLDVMERALGGALRMLEKEIEDVLEHLQRARAPLDRGVQSAVMLRDHLLQALPLACKEDHHLVRTYLPAIRAICQHNLPEEEVDQGKDPLSFLMVICDELQDWARTRVQLPELKRHTVFRTVDDANWQERRIPVLTEVILPVAGIRDGDVVLALEKPPSSGGQPGARRRILRIPFIQIYAPDEVGYLNPIYLWLLRAQNLQRLRRHERGDVALDVEIHTVTHLPRRLQNAGLSFRAALAEIATARPELALEDLVTHLDRAIESARHPVGPPHGQEHREEVCPTWTGWQEIRDACQQRQPGGAELQVFRIASLNQETPVRGYPTEKNVSELARAYQQFLHEREGRLAEHKRRYLDMNGRAPWRK